MKMACQLLMMFLLLLVFEYTLLGEAEPPPTRNDRRGTKGCGSRATRGRRGCKNRGQYAEARLRLFWHRLASSRRGTACKSGPCQNGGSCIGLLRLDKYRCVCAAGFTGAVCEVSTTDGCFWKGQNGYSATWVYSAADSTVTFKLSIQRNATEWIGIGFSQDVQMNNTDIILGYFVGDDGRIEDRWASGRFMPTKDNQSDISATEISRAGSILTMQFTRKVQTGDSAQDVSLGVNSNCVYFLFPEFPGNITTSGSIAAHQFGERNPVGRGPFCLSSCVPTQDVDSEEANSPKCTPTSCKNDGICVTSSYSKRCLCPFMFEGFQCEIKRF